MRAGCTRCLLGRPWTHSPAAALLSCRCRLRFLSAADGGGGGAVFGCVSGSANGWNVSTLTDPTSLYLQVEAASALLCPLTEVDAVSVLTPPALLLLDELFGSCG